MLKAMVLNDLGFASAPLYLFSEFFESKAVGHVLGESLEASHLNDDRLGRVFDELYEAGTSGFSLQVAMAAVERFASSAEQIHLDSTSFSLQGKDAFDEPPEGEPVGIGICRGYLRDHRRDLKQCVLNLMCSADRGVPLWLQAARGNQSDAQ